MSSNSKRGKRTVRTAPSASAKSTEDPNEAENRQSMSLILSRMAELELSKDEDEISKEFLHRCKIESESLLLDEDEKQSAIIEFRGLISDPSFDSAKIQEIFMNKIAINNNLRRNFMNNFSEWKNMLKERKSDLKTRCQLETDIVSQQTINKQLQDIYNDVITKSTEVNNNTNNLIQAEISYNNEIQAKLSKTLEDAQSKLNENSNDMNNKISDNNHIKEKISELTTHYNIQKERYDEEIQYKGLQSHSYQTKLQYKKEIDNKYKQEIDKYIDSINTIMSSIHDMKNQINICALKTTEFHSSIDRSEDIYLKYVDQQKSIESFLDKINAEIDNINVNIKELETNLLMIVNKIQKSDENMNQLKSQLDEKIATCRTLQEKRSLLQSELFSKSKSTSNEIQSDDVLSIPVVKIPPSSSSSSSSTRMLREHATETAGEESPAASSPGVCYTDMIG